MWFCSSCSQTERMSEPALVYFFFVLKDVEHRLDVEQDGDRQVDGVVVVFDHHPAQTRALGPADVAHRLASGVLGKADGQHRVLKDEAVDRNVPDDARRASAPAAAPALDGA